MNTFWFYVNGHRVAAYANTQDNAIQKLDSAPSEKVSDTPCHQCPWQGACNASSWKEPRINQPSLEDSEVLSMVHICAACFTCVLSTRDTDRCMQVPEGCPRWDPEDAGAGAWLCDHCHARTRLLRESHPEFSQQMEVISKALTAAMRGGSFSGASVRTGTVPVQSVSTNITLSILRDDMTEEYLPDLAVEDDPVQLREWLEWASLLWERHAGDRAAFLSDFYLILLDTLPKVLWSRLPITHRRLLLTRWEDIVESHTVKAAEA